MTAWEDTVRFSPTGPPAKWRGSGDKIRRGLARVEMKCLLGTLARIQREKYTERIRALSPQEIRRMLEVLSGED